MRNLKVARRYAKALLLLGREDGQAETYRTQMEDFASVLQNSPDLASALHNPIHPVVVRRAVLNAVLEKLNPAPVTTSFFRLLFDKGRILYLPDIARLYGELADELKGIARARLTTAVDLPDETAEQIRQGLSRMTGKEVVLAVEKDPALIGGVVARIGDLVLDGSVRTQLHNLKESLKRSEAV
ncbi:MAG: ATP synthase F1 subunit delta [Desulfatibacillaceae bacterium]|nr:ATP synthase F1 subunit delta [Desulfatibacillaceae bacterium]